MKNSWFTFGFLGVMLVALVALAVLQYRWLGSVSEAEKERLEENLSASTENFITDFNEVFQELSNSFRLQISDKNTEIAPLVFESLQNWKANAAYSPLVEALYLIRKGEDENAEISLFKIDDGLLVPDLTNNELENWAVNHFSKVDYTPGSIPLSSFPDFGEESFIQIPIQFLDFIEVRKEDGGQNVDLQLTVNQLNDLVVLDLNDAYIKNEIIPEIARRYFSDSYDDQYQLSIIKSDDEQDVYFSSEEGEEIPEPDFKSTLMRFNLSSVLVLGDMSGTRGLRFPARDSTHVSAWQAQTHFEDNDEPKSGDTNIRVFTTEKSEFTIRSTNTSAIGLQRSDTTIATSFLGSLNAPAWELWLSFKDGSLDAFVNKTRNRNLAISFGILGILGISVVMIVLAAQRSRELSEQQMLFVAGVSHELRTPITVIRSAAENLSEGVVQTEERKQEYARLMLKEGRHLSDMVDQIMEFSGIQTGKRVFNFSEVEVAQLMSDLLEEYRPVLESEGIQLEYSNVVSQKTLYADRDALFLSISNLLSNAIKFSGESQKIKLTVAELDTPTTGAQLSVIVQDFGIGIPTEEQKQVFKPFFRGSKPVADQVKGNGIGLSLVQKVAKAHHGEIRLKSEPGKGSTFILLIPFSHE